MTQGGIRLSEVGLKDLKFDVALNLTKLSYDYKEKTQTDIKRYLDLLIPIDFGVEVISHIFWKISIIKISSKDIFEFEEHYNTSLEVTAIQEEYLFKNSSPFIQNKLNDWILDDKLKRKKIPSVILCYFVACKSFDLVLKKSQDSKLSLTEDSTALINLNIIVYYGRTYHAFKIYNKIWILTKDHLIMIHNKVHETFNVLLISWLLNDGVFSDGFFTKTVKLIEWMIDQVADHGNLSYTIFKSLDGIASAQILSREKLFDNSSPFFDMINELVDQRLLRPSSVRFLEEIFSGSEQEVIELSSLSKLLGHPNIDTFKGLTKLRSRAVQRNEIPREDVITLINSMKKGFIHQYLITTKKWPLVNLSHLCNPRLVYCCLHNKWIHDPMIPKNLPKVELKDFCSIELGKILEFDYIDSQFDILKDTALSPLLSEIFSPIISVKRNPKDQRTLLYFLMTNHPHEEVRKYFEAISCKDPKALEYMVIKLTQKERELKEEGRFFGQSPYVERARRCILEHNVSNLMIRFNRSQAMTLTELQKFQKLYILSRIGYLDPSYIPINFSVDVEGFNNNFRDTICTPVANEFFNKLFGTTNFSFTMKLFEQSYIYASDGVIDIGWDGQLGGIEGLYQKFWTWIYGSVAEKVAEQFGYKYHIMINGDDLRVVLLIPRHEYNKMTFRGKLTTIAQEFEQNYNKFGFKLKLQETYFSSEYLGFGKMYIYQGHFLSMTLKKGQKLHGMANLIGDLPLEYLKGVQSEVISTASYSCSHRQLYIVGLIRTQMYLSNYNSQFIHLDEFRKVALLLFPSGFGGFPILPYLRCLYKGESDLETQWLSLYFFILTHNSSLGEFLFSLVFSCIMQTNEYQGLATNPYSLPNVTPAEGVTIIQQYLRSHIESITENREFYKILRKVNEMNKFRFIQGLYNCDPIPAKSLSVLYSTSAAGQIDEFIQKFDSSKSLGGFISKGFKNRKSNQILKRAKRMDVRKIDFLVDLIKNQSQMIYRVRDSPDYRDYLDCPTQFSSLIRNWCYRKEILGVTYPSPVDQIMFFDTSQLVDLRNSDYITIQQSRLTIPTNVNYGHGPHDIYLGNHTHLKLIPPDLELRNTSPGLKRVNKILKIYTMMETLGKECQNYLKESLTDLTGMDPDLLISICCKHTSGCTTHRLPTSHWSPLVGNNDINNVSTFIKVDFSTDHNSRMRAGDWTINYGLIKSHIIRVSSYECEFTSIISPRRSVISWAKVSTCHTCTHEVSDRPVRWLSNPPKLNFDLSDNIYSSLDTKECTIIEDLIHTYNKTPQFVHAQRSKDNPTLYKESCLALISKTLIEYQELTIQRSIGEDHGLSLDEDYLSQLYMIKTVEVVTLTDLKCTPTEALISEMYLYFVNWVMKNHPKEYGSHDIGIILNLHPKFLPFFNLCSSFLVCGYWQVLRKELTRTSIDKTAPGFYKQSTSQIQLFIIQRFLDKMYEEFSTSVSAIPLTETIPIRGDLTPEGIQNTLRNRIEVLGNNYIFRWMNTPSGRRIRNYCLSGNYDHIKTDLNILCSIKITTKDLNVYDNNIIHLFEYDQSKSSKDILRYLDYFLCLPSHPLSTIIFDALSTVEASPPTTEIARYFLSKSVEFVFIPISEASQIVRQIELTDYKQFYNQPGPSTSGSQIHEVREKYDDHLINKVEVDFTIDSTNLIITHQYQRLIEMLRDKSSEFNIGLKFLFGLFGHSEGRLSSWLLLLRAESKVTASSSVVNLLLNDKNGSVTAAHCLYYTNSRNIPLVYSNSDDPSESKLSEINQLSLESKSSLDLSLISADASHFCRIDHQKLIIHHIKSLGSRLNNIYLRYDAMIIQDWPPGILKVDLIRIMNEFLDSSISLFIDIHMSLISQSVVTTLFELSCYFNQFSIQLPVDHFHKPGVLLFIYSEFNYRDELTLKPLIDQKCFEKIDFLMLSVKSMTYEMFINKNYRLISDTLVFLKEKAGVIPLYLFQSHFGTLLEGVQITVLSQDSWELRSSRLIAHINSKINILRSELIKKKEGIDSLHSKIHSSRMMIESVLCKTFVNKLILQENLIDASVAFSKLDLKILCLEAINDLLEQYNLDVSSALSEDWINTLYIKFIIKLIKFVFWVRFTSF